MWNNEVCTDLTVQVILSLDLVSFKQMLKREEDVVL